MERIKLQKTIEKFILNNEKGMFLLDSPTGFGKTTAVLHIIKDFLSGGKYQDIERMFFVTNLKTNLPVKDLFMMLDVSEQEKCIRIKSYEECVEENFNKVNIDIPEIINSKEYKMLKNDLSTLEYLRTSNSNAVDDGSQIQRVANYRSKIESGTEPAFRNFIVSNYLSGRSRVDKKKFVDENEWFRILYPTSIMESKKVVFMTTSKFISPMNVFYRMPFYMYNDKILNNSTVFIDEFDSSHKYVLNQLIDNSLKIKVDIISLFTNIYYVLNNIQFPSELLKMKADEKFDDEADNKLYSSEEIINLNKDKFNEIYERHNLQYFLKSFGINGDKAFLFDDGHYITAKNDKAQKSFWIYKNDDENYLKLVAEKLSEISLQKLLCDINYAVLYFTKGVEFLAANYFKAKNEKIENDNKDIKKKNKDDKYRIKYSREEALMTVLSAFGLSDDNREYLKMAIMDGRFSYDVDMSLIRKGFRFTEVEDSNYHDLQTISHVFNFETVPENIIYKVAGRARLVGVSATATLPTVIGNYDLKYLKSILKDAFVDIDYDDKMRIAEDFGNSQEVYSDVDISVELLDDLPAISISDKINMLLKKIYSDDILKKYQNIFSTNHKNEYYNFIMTKMAYIYKMMQDNNIRAFIAFVNKLPSKNDDKVNLGFLTQMFEDINLQSGGVEIYVDVLSADTYDYKMNKIHGKIKEGLPCLAISSYNTIGSGKNIQCKIPSCVDNILRLDKTRDDIDFDGIYVQTPTNLIQRIGIESEDKYADLARYLYQQQSLYLNNYLMYSNYSYNIICGFKKAFFNDKWIQPYSKNKDLSYNTAQIVIQAVGRICRCRNKNKKVYIYSDSEIVERLARVKEEFGSRIFNAEFTKLLNKCIENEQKHEVESYDKQNKRAYYSIRNSAWHVRHNALNVENWKELRDYVLRNPTTNSVLDKYMGFYFKFGEAQYGYAHRYKSGFTLAEIKFGFMHDMESVSYQESDLKHMLAVPCIDKLFSDKGYTKQWKKGVYNMSPNLFNQVYKAAIGEVSGKAILEDSLGYTLEELDNYKMYELFDFKVQNVYIDFKHWDTFITDRTSQVDKIRRKLNRVDGEKAIIINIIKRGEHEYRESLDGDIIEIPYLIDENGEVDELMMGRIADAVVT